MPILLCTGIRMANGQMRRHYTFAHFVHPSVILGNGQGKLDELSRLLDGLFFLFSMGDLTTKASSNNALILLLLVDVDFLCVCGRNVCSFVIAVVLVCLGYRGFM